MQTYINHNFSVDCSIGNYKEKLYFYFFMIPNISFETTALLRLHLYDIFGGGGIFFPLSKHFKVLCLGMYHLSMVN